MKKLLLVLLFAFPALAQQAVERDLSCSPVTASGTTYACNITVAPGSYVSGQPYRFLADVANTGAATINFNSLGARAITKTAGGITTALVANDIQAGMWVDLVYDGAQMQMTGPTGNAGSSSGGTYNNITINNSTTNNLKCNHCSLNGSELSQLFPNDAVTGSAVNKLVSLTGAGTIITTTAGATGDVLGVCTGNTSTGASVCGTAGSSEVAQFGEFPITFDGATTADDYVGISASVNGDVTDLGATCPPGRQIIGRVLVTAAAGVRNVMMFGPGTYCGTAFVRNASIPSAGCNASAGAAAWDLPTSNAPAPNCLGTSYRFGSLDYDDAANETATFHFELPTGWTGNVDLVVWGLVNGTTQQFKLTVATVCIATSTSMINPTFNAAQTVTVTSPGTANQAFTFTQNTVTTTGCSAGNIMVMKIGRDTTDTSTLVLSITEADLSIRVTPQA